jgi:hypothetical protein
MAQGLKAPDWQKPLGDATHLNHGAGTVSPSSNHAINLILTIPERFWLVRSLPMKEGVLTWEQCSRVQVPTKLLREPT